MVALLVRYIKAVVAKWCAPCVELHPRRGACFSSPRAFAAHDCFGLLLANEGGRRCTAVLPLSAVPGLQSYSEIDPPLRRFSLFPGVFGRS